MDGKKDGLQKYKVRINYTDSYGNYKQLDRVTYGKEEAKALEVKLTADVKEKDVSLSTKTINQLAEEYLCSKKSDVRETTLDKTRRNLNQYILPTLGAYKLNKINTPILTKWKSEIDSDGYSIKTKQNIYGELRALLNYAVKVEYIPKNPLTLVGNFRETEFIKPSDRIRYYTSEQFKAYITTAEKLATSEDTANEWMYYVFFNIAYYTGLRKGEINALKWSDLDNNIIHIRRSVSQKIKGKNITETAPKNKSSYRDVQIPKPLLQILSDNKIRQMEYFKEFFSEDFRICGGDKCLPDTTIDKHNRKYATLSGLPRITIHEFRHSHATLLANAGINIQEISRRLGHSNIEETWNTYSHLYPHEEEKAIEILNNIV